MEKLFSLVAAPAENTAERDYQHGLHLFEAHSQRLGSTVYDRSQLVMGAVPSVYLGEFLAKSFHPSAVTGLAGLIDAWRQARLGRKVRIKIGHIEVEASTLEEVEHLLEKARIVRSI